MQPRTCGMTGEIQGPREMGLGARIRRCDPEPIEEAVSRSGNIYSTYTSAGVVVEARNKYDRY